MAPSSRFALSLKPNVAYLELNFCALWKKQTTLPFLAYAGIPYQVLGKRPGAVALMIAWSRSAMTRSDSGISAIFASKSLSPSALPARGPRRPAAFSSLARSFTAARSSAVKPSTVSSIAAVVLADFCVSFIAGFLSPTFSMISAGRALRSGHRLMGDFRRLEDPDGVAEGIADAHVDAVEVLGGLLGEVGDPARLQNLVQTPDVVRLEDEGAHGALRDQLAE